MITQHTSHLPHWTEAFLFTVILAIFALRFFLHPWKSGRAFLEQPKEHDYEQFRFTAESKQVKSS